MLPKRILLEASATKLPPSSTPVASCGHVAMVLPISGSEARIRSLMVSMPTMRPSTAVRSSRVAARAAANGVHVLALTDHDEVGGLAEAAAAAASAGMIFIPGV
ncbi:MAG: hypothetical protein ACK4L7_04800, partial [Flavobacteriales bacterium]